MLKMIEKSSASFLIIFSYQIIFLEDSNPSEAKMESNFKKFCNKNKETVIDRKIKNLLDPECLIINRNSENKINNAIRIPLLGWIKKDNIVKNMVMKYLFFK